MKGNNEIHLCAASMIEAMQEWADEHMTDPVTVVGVEAKSEAYSGVTFVVKVTPRDEAPK